MKQLLAILALLALCVPAIAQGVALPGNATSTRSGLVKPDNSTLSVSGGTLSVILGNGSGAVYNYVDSLVNSAVASAVDALVPITSLGSGLSLSNGVLSATGTSYTAGSGLTLTGNSFAETLPITSVGTGLSLSAGALTNTYSYSLTMAGIDAALGYTPGTGNGTVTSVGLSLPGLLYSLTGSPVTGAGTIAASLVNQTANTFLAGPASGSAAAPTMRVLVPADIASGAANTYIPYDNAGVLAWETAPSGSLPTGTTGQTIYYNGTTATASSALQNNNAEVAVGGATPSASAALSVQGLAASDAPTLGSELTAQTGWTTGAGWAGDNVAGFTFTPGTATALTYPISGLGSGKWYQIVITMTGRTAGGVTPSMGGWTGTDITATGTQQAVTTGSTVFTVTPDSTFNGTITVSVEQWTAATYQQQWQTSNGSVRANFRADATSQYLGYQAGQYSTGGGNSAEGAYALFSNTTGSYNSAEGAYALFSNTTGSNNSAEGAYALFSNTTGSNNSAEGVVALQNNTTGSNNSAEGYQALYSNTTGSSNSAEGLQALFSNTTGSNNSAVGQNALFSNTSGSSNLAEGYQAGYGTSSSYANTTGSNNTFLGYETSFTGSTQYNYAMALGSLAQVGESNACVIGGTGSAAVRVGFGGVTAPAASVDSQAYNTTTPCSIDRAVSGQTVDMHEAVSSTNAVLSRTNSAGMPCLPLRTVAVSTDTATNADGVIEFSASSAETLPTPSATNAGESITLVDLGSYTITVTNTVLGSPSDTLSTTGSSETFLSDATNWILKH